MSAVGLCPECEFTFPAGDLAVGETLACPECALTLQIVERTSAGIRLEAIETELPDWGE
jgi:alpha-aminoadipate carrier protein LysW